MIPEELLEYQRIATSQTFDEASLDYSIYHSHLEKLRLLESMYTSSYSIFDMSTQRHTYLSENFARTFGYDLKKAEADGNTYLDNRVHPEDLLKNAMAGGYFLKYILAIVPELRLQYKFVSEYRIENGKGVMLRVIEQFQVLELDQKGNIWLVLCVMDVAPNQNLSAPYQCRAINFHTGNLFELPEGFFNSKNGNSKLSGRETEILKLISTGLLSKEIADQLYISVHTVNTHRQKILEKLKADNTMEAVQLARRVGLL